MNSRQLTYSLILTFVFLLGILVSYSYQRQKSVQLTPGKPFPLATVTPAKIPSEIDWHTKKNDQVGFEFQYPSKLKISEDSGQGETGNVIGLRFSSTLQGLNETLRVYSHSRDYTAGRGGLFTDCRGYLNKSGKIYFIFTEDKQYQIPKDAIKDILRNKNNVEIAIITGKDSVGGEYQGPIEGTPGEGAIGALINTPNTKYPCIAFQYSTSYTTISYEEFIKILSTVKFTTPVSSNDSTASSWQTYKNDEYGFEFKYPLYYKTDGIAGGRDIPVLALVNKNNQSSIAVLVSQSKFSQSNLLTYAPTGQDGIAPTPITLGGNSFYYYGPGGGGVQYPDLYFINAKGNLLIFSFNGPYDNDKTPTAEGKALAKQILSTFKSSE